MSALRRPRQSEAPVRLKSERAAELVCTACVTPTSAAELRLKHIPGIGVTPMCRWCAADVDTIEDMICRLTNRRELNA